MSSSLKPTRVFLSVLHHHFSLIFFLFLHLLKVRCLPFPQFLASVVSFCCTCFLFMLPSLYRQLPLESQTSITGSYTSAYHKWFFNLKIANYGAIVSISAMEQKISPVYPVATNIWCPRIKQTHIINKCYIIFACRMLSLVNREGSIGLLGFETQLKCL